MKLVINSTDFSDIGTALYYTRDNKFLPGWIYDTNFWLEEDRYKHEGDVEMPNELSDPAGFISSPDEIGYFTVDAQRYYAFSTPELLYLNPASLSVSGYRYQNVLYHGSKSRVLLRDFAEYDFSFLVDKYKFNDKLKLKFLDNASKDLIGLNVSELTKLEDILFPTLLETDEVNREIEYFGTTIIGTYTLFLFPVPRGIRKVELYEGTKTDLVNVGTDYDYRLLCGQDITEKPVLSVYLGPDYRWSNNDPGEYLVDPATWDDGYRMLASPKDYLRGLDEIESDKVLWLVITDSGQLLDINLSYNSWSSDKVNPERNKWKYSLRNDEFWSTKYNTSIVDNKSGILLDGRSNTILSTDKVASHPILDRKLRKFDLSPFIQGETYNTGDKVRYRGRLWESAIDNNTTIPGEEGSDWIEKLQTYSPYCSYRLGDRVLYNDQVWESLCDFNSGNRPDISRQWILSESTENMFTSRVNILINPSGAGRAIPGGQVRIDTADTEKNFVLYENLGYALESADRVCSARTNTYLTGVSINVSSVAIEDGQMDRKTVTIPGNEFDSIIESRQLIFNFRPVATTITLQGDYGGTIYPYVTWGNRFNGEEIKLKLEDGTVINSNTLSMTPRQTLVIEPENGLINNKFSRVVSVYKDRYGVTRMRELEMVDNRITDYIDFSEAVYTFYITKNEMIVSCIEGYTYFDLEDNMVSIPYGENHTFRFRPIEGSSVIVNFLEIEIEGQTIQIPVNGSSQVLSGVNIGSLSYNATTEIYEITFTNIIHDINIKIKI